MTKYEQALKFATNAHGDQKRKYTGEPYINHPVAVAKALSDLGYKEDVLCAALLHDVVEDTPITIQNIYEEFGPTIAQLVEQVTDVYTTEAFPNIRRKERKLLECYRLSKISNDAKSIKLSDLIDNTASITEHDKGFAEVYLQEKEEMLAVLTQGNGVLHHTAHVTLLMAKSEIS